VRCAEVDVRINFPGMSEIHLSAPAIAALKACSIQAAHKQLSRGYFGPILRVGRNCFVPISGVERRLGQRFSEAQLTQAAAGQPGRVLLIPDSNEEAA
jgi:hypothetical protein